MKWSNETKIGIMIVAVLLVLGLMTFKAGDFQFSKDGYIVKLHFFNIDGVGKNTPVMFNGFEVGYVKDIHILDQSDRTVMELDVFIEGDVKLHQGIKAHVKNLGFLGEKFVSLVAAGSSKEYIQPDAVIVGNEPANIDQLMQDGEQIAGDIKDIVGQVKGHFQKNREEIDGILANLNNTLQTVSVMAEQVNNRLITNESNIDETMTNIKDISINLEKASANLDELTYDLKLNPWKLLYKPKDRSKSKK